MKKVVALMKKILYASILLSIVLSLTGCEDSNSSSSSGKSSYSSSSYGKSSGYSSYSSSSSGSSYSSSSSGSSSGSRASVSQLSFGEPSIKTGSINDTIYVKVTNNSSDTLTGSIKAYIYYNNQIQDSAVLYLPNDGLAPGDSATIDGIFNTINGKWDDVEFQASTLRTK